jgi:ParB/RepB/Spo0J family partition protein
MPRAKKASAIPPVPTYEEQLAEAAEARARAPVTALDTGRLEKVRLDQLDVSPLNVRKDAEVGPDDELVHSIRAHGLLQPLIGYLAKTGTALVLVCAGQRRLLALRHVAAGETLIPVRIVDETTAIEVSLAENLERKAMNPADELDAFQALLATGHYDANRIADRFGFDRRYVRRRLKMGVLHPDILAALREGTIGIASAEAYAASDDQALQQQVFKEQSRPNCYAAHSPDSVVRSYACAGIAADSGVGKFIGGIGAYEAAGGVCRPDEAFSELFADNASYRGERLTDAGIVARLLSAAQEKAHEEAAELARDVFPFAASVLWCDARGNPPKPAKDSGLVVAQTGWNAATGKYRDEGDLKKLAARIAKDGGTVMALAEVDNDGKVAIVTCALMVDKAALEAATAKDKTPGASGSRAPMTAEERAALDRERNIKQCALNLLGRSLIGETPGFVVTGCSPHWQGGIKIELRDRKREQLSFSDLEKMAEPFLDQATARVDAAAVKAAEETDEGAADTEDEAEPA